MSDEETVTITLHAREARTLLHAANLMADAWQSVLSEHDRLESVIASAGVPPLQAAAMKLELALIQARIEI